MAPAVRAALATATPARLIDDLTIEAIESHGSVSVARVWALTVRRTDDGWEQPAVERYGVPLAEEAGGMRAVGAPWMLPSPGPKTVVWERVADPTASASAVGAVTASGYAGVTRPVHERAPQLGVARLTFTGRPPDGSAPGRHIVWLTDDAKPRVLGLPLPDVSASEQPLGVGDGG